jgi:hypothetical protein
MRAIDLEDRSSQMKNPQIKNSMQFARILDLQLQNNIHEFVSDSSKERKFVTAGQTEFDGLFSQ